jgi:6-pyruvoyl-tetrahydropterin synthase
MNRTITLTPKVAKISGAHSLACFGDGHPCARKHGHTWWVRATFAGEPDASGILIDYEVVRDVIKDLDRGPGRHEILSDHYDLDAVMAPLPSTGENLLLLLAERFVERCLTRGSHVSCVRVELSEDPVPGDAHTLVWAPMLG